MSPDGTAVPVSQSRMRQGFEKAEFLSRPATRTAESGVMYTVPTEHGPIDVRLMEGSASHPQRAVFTRAGTNDPVKMSGERIRGTVAREERRALSHVEQKP